MAALDDALTQKALDWLKNFLQREHGIWFATCTKRGDWWFCYDQQGHLVIKVADAMIDRIFLAQERLEWLADGPAMDPGDNLQTEFPDEEDGA